MTRIDTFVPGKDDRTLAPRPSDLANQRDSWLRQMELAQLTDMSLAGRTLTGRDAEQRPTRAAESAPISSKAAIDSKKPQKLALPDRRETMTATVQPVYQFNLSAATPPQAAPTVAESNTTQTIGSAAATPSTARQVLSPAAPYSGTASLPELAIATRAIASVTLPDSQPALPAPISAIASRNVSDQPNMPVGSAPPSLQAAQSPLQQAEAAGAPSVTAPSSPVANQQTAAQPFAQAATTHGDTTGNTDETPALEQPSVSTVTMTPNIGMNRPTQQITASADNLSATENLLKALPGAPATTPTFAMAGSRGQNETGAEDEAATPEAPTEQSELTEKPEFQKRLMHLTSDGSDVSLWIRDSELSQQQSQNLVYRLAGDFANAGMRLRGITVNGKPAWQANDVNSDSHSRTTSAQDSEEASAIEGTTDMEAQRKQNNGTE